jgi:hypothetical protein
MTPNTAMNGCHLAPVSAVLALPATLIAKVHKGSRGLRHHTRCEISLDQQRPSLDQTTSSSWVRAGLSYEDNKNARADQRAINYTQSQAESTYYTRSLAESLIRDRSIMDDTGDDRVSRVSMYTYNTTDKEQYLRQERGRVSIFILPREVLI